MAQMTQKFKIKDRHKRIWTVSFNTKGRNGYVRLGVWPRGVKDTFLCLGDRPVWVPASTAALMADGAVRQTVGTLCTTAKVQASFFGANRRRRRR